MSNHALIVSGFPLDDTAREILLAPLPPGTEAVALPDLSPEARAAALSRASAYLGRNTAKELQPGEAPLLAEAKLIQFMNAGVDFVPLRALPAQVPIACNGGAYAEPMAEHALAMALAAAKRLFIEHAALARGEFNQMTRNRSLAGMVCGILGFGGIGAAIARLMRPMGVAIHAIKRGPTNETVDWLGTPDKLEEMLAAADILVLSVPLTEKTRGIIDGRALALMKKDAILINLARGEVVDEAALFAHLQANPEFTACIDAWWVEPIRHGQFRMEHPFMSLPNVIGSPHNSASVGGVTQMALAARRTILPGRCARSRSGTWSAPMSGRRRRKDKNVPKDGTETPGIETRWSWIIAVAAVVILSVSFGAPLIVTVGLRDIAESMGEARSLPSLVASLAYVGAGLGGVLMGWVAGRTSARLVAVLGSVMVTGGLLLASGGAPWQLLLGFGLMVGLLGNGALYPPMMAYVSLWFDKRRGTALALVASGQYVAGALWPALIERGIATLGWQRTMALYAGVVALVALPLAALVLRPAPLPPPGSAAAAGPVAGARVLGMAPNLALALLGLASFLCCIPMAMPAAHLVAFCGDLGLTRQSGAAMLSVLLVAAFVARQFWGWVADRIGGLHAVIAGNICQTVGMAAFLATADEAGLFLVAAAFGLGFSGIVPAYILAVRELFPAQEASWRVPALLFLSLSGMAAGAWLAGVLYDGFGNYAVAWQAGIAANLAALALLGALAWRRRAGLAVPA
ncbi:MFS transporter [Siccirubricoccus phaeus]|uniref:MFS transporter n=1 Tax=Siccirubricoccus phaeus TaxID=2595053 RepID=UPI00165A1A96|nr:MFS transporter [Siccirubricoccus phaeus]